MSKGSEQFAWKLYEGVPHICALCQRALLVKDVAQVHTVYADGKGETGFRCTTCVR